MRILAIVVVYNPNINNLLSNIYTYIYKVDKLIIWRNSQVDIKIEDYYKDKIIFMGDGNNEYIAKPLNVAIDYCCQNNYNYLLTMDQDTSWLNFNQFIEDISLIKQHNIAIYAPNVNNCFSIEKKTQEVETVITSGSLLNVSIAKELGGFREDYKIYWVDGEFCTWCRCNNKSIVVMADSHIVQEFGTRSDNIFGKYAYNYSPIIYYYMFRNMLWMRREYKEQLSLKCIIYTSFIYIRGILLAEKNKIIKLKYILKGIYEGLYFNEVMYRYR